MTLANPIPCAGCRGRGWVDGVTEWPEACPLCQGRGDFDSVARLARGLGFTPRQLRRVWACEPTKKLGLEVLTRIAEVFPSELGIDGGTLPLFGESLFGVAS